MRHMFSAAIACLLFATALSTTQGQGTKPEARASSLRILSGNDQEVLVGTKLFTVGGGVSRPRLTRKIDPEYSEEALKAKVGGIVVLAIEVWPDGKAHNIRVIRSLGWRVRRFRVYHLRDNMESCVERVSKDLG